MTNQDTLNQLASIAAGLNHLAKQLPVYAQKQEVYRLKACACGTAVMLGGAVVDGKRADDIVGLVILSTPAPMKIHVKVSHLQPAARSEVRRQTPTVFATAPFCEALDADELRMLKNLVARKGPH